MRFSFTLMPPIRRHADAVYAIRDSATPLMPPTRHASSRRLLRHEAMPSMLMLPTPPAFHAMISFRCY